MILGSQKLVGVLHPDWTPHELAKRARCVRATCVQLAHDGREGHLNGALSSVDLLVTLFNSWLRLCPEKHDHPERDRFIFSKGHACVALYSVMADCGYFQPSDLRRYATEGGPFPSHPCIHALPALDCSSGSLGNGLGIATGRSYALRLAGSSARVVALLSDGECNEGSTWEAAMVAASKRLDNLLVVIDNNGVQSVGRTDALNGGTSLEEKFRAFGWSTCNVDGHDITSIRQALHNFPFVKGKPSAIIARTCAEAGVSFMEDQVLWHYRVPSIEDLRLALTELGATPIHLSLNTGIAPDGSSYGPGDNAFQNHSPAP